MNPNLLVACLPLLLVSVPALGASAPLSPAEKSAAFKAAGYTLKSGKWHGCDDPTPNYTPGEIQEVRDLNGDGYPEAVIVEGGTYCYGNTGTGYSVVSKQANGSWKLITSGPGIPTFLNTKGVANWPDIEVGGPGFCFPVERWNGRQYVLQRHQYEGKPCRRK